MVEPGAFAEPTEWVEWRTHQNDDAHSDCTFAETVVYRHCELGMVACEAGLKQK